jgi:hypothetical protein
MYIRTHHLELNLQANGNSLRAKKLKVLCLHNSTKKEDQKIARKKKKGKEKENCIIFELYQVLSEILYNFE